MSENFSILDAGREAGQSIGLVEGGREYRFAELARMAERRMEQLSADGPLPRFHAVAGTNSVDTLVTLYALLELRVPALMLHPRLTVGEVAAEIEATERASHGLPADAAAILYTSGTTGRAKGAVLTRGSLAASARASAANMGWQEGDRWMLVMPVARVGGLSILTRCLAARQAVVLCPKFDAADMPGLLERQKVSLVSLVPTMLSLVFQAHPEWTPAPRLRAVQLGGAAASAGLLARASQRRLPVLITYGCTETCSQVAVTPYDMRWEAARSGVGRPLPGAEIRIDEGRVMVRGAMRMAGYLGEAALSPQAWFDTGDLGEFDTQGFLHLNGRRTDLVVTGGENVYPVEVERVLEACPGVEAAAVFGVPDEIWGHTIALAMVPGEHPPADQELRDFARRHLASYKRPRWVCHVPDLPLNGAGKLDRPALAALCSRLRPLRG